MRLPVCLVVGAFLVGTAFADGPGDNQLADVRPVPPLGSALPEPVREELKKGLTELQGLIKDIGKHDLLPDVQIYEKAVRWALDYNEVYDNKGAAPGGTVKSVLKMGLERATAMKAGKTPWTTATGLVVRGYQSKIDGSVQPYGLVIPKEYDFAAKTPHRLDFWWHGRYENVVEAGFINERSKNPGEFTPKGAIVLHPFGRFSNANKLAGEIDSFECLDDVKKHYRVDDKRIVARGFSMGGAACWQYAVHYPTLFCAAAPGAGFSETPEFLKVFQNEKVEPTWYEKKLWGMYNATDTAQNIFNIPTVAYSGEKDNQKQAADVMAREMKKLGMELTHIIGPGAGHNYEKAAKEEVNKRIDAFAEKGLPTDRKEIKFVTYSLRYNRCDWLTVTGLDKHWERAIVNAKKTDANDFIITTDGVRSLRITVPPTKKFSITIDGKKVTETLSGNRVIPQQSLHYRKVDGQGWAMIQAENEQYFAKNRKIPGLQGPIDDAFLDSFLMVSPTGKPISDAIGKWTAQEMKHATDHWRKQFRGDAPMKADKDVTDDDIKNNNLILWGDPKSNAILAKIADKLPLAEFGDNTVTLSVYPNPLNPKKYVVLNSGFTFREYDYLNNARQVPKLPDYAIVDVSTPANSRYPGKVIRAGFFDEQWKLQKDDGKGK